MPLVTDEEIRELRDIQLEACDMTCTVERETTARDTSGGVTSAWETVAGAVLIPCRISQGGAASGGVSGAREETAVGDVEVAAGLLACTLITDATITEDDRITVWPDVRPGESTVGQPSETYPVAEVKLPLSYRLAVRVGLDYRR